MGRAKGALRMASGGGLRGLRRTDRLADARQEERLVDASLEDRDSQFHALGDDFAPLESGLSCQLGRRQVNGHRSVPPWGVYSTSTCIARPADILNICGRKSGAFRLRSGSG